MDVRSWRSLRNATMNATTRLGERSGIEWLVYNPLVYRLFHEMAMENSPGLVAGISLLFPDVRRVAEVGCGTGVFARALMDRGFEVTACEYSPRARRHAERLGVEAGEWRLQPHLDQQLRGGPFDLVTSFEVAEHVPEALADRFCDFIAAAPLVILSAAPPGQGGHGHINEQPQRYWIDKLDVRSYDHDLDASKRLAHECGERGAADWLTNNFMVFRRR